MEFTANSTELISALSPAIDVATRNTSKEFKHAHRLTIKATKDELVAFAYGGKASVIAPISDKKFGRLNYDCQTEGVATVGALNMFEALKSLPEGDVKVLVNGDLSVSLLSDEDYSRSTAIYEDIVSPPNIAKKFNQEIKINREIFVAGLKKVTFATAFEDKMWCYQCVVFEIIDDEIRFSAGSGGRFVVDVIKGKNISETADKNKIIFPHQNVPNLIKVLSEAKDADILIKYGQAEGADAIPEQIVVEFDGMTLCIFGIESYTNYPDLSKVIDHKYPNRVFCDLKEWDYVVQGINFSKREHKDDIHNTEVTLQPDNEKMIIETRTAHKAKTPVKMVDPKKCIIVGDDIWFRCNSEYLEDMLVCGKKTGKVSMNFESQSLLSDTSDKKIKKLRPVLIKYPEIPDAAKNTKENFYLFFSTSSK